MTRPSTGGHATGPVRQKSTLYCPACDHASAIDGDWTRRVRGATIEYACPACGTAIVRRPRSSETDPTPPKTAWGRAAWRSVDFWRASVGAGLRVTSALIERNRPER